MDTNTLSPPILDMPTEVAGWRAAAGAALFDAAVPGWADRIDTDTLNVASVHCCPAAQLAGIADIPQETLDHIRDWAGGDLPCPYLVGLMFLVGDREFDAVAHGFDVGFWDGPHGTDSVWVGSVDVNAAWLVEVQRRRTVTA